MRQWRATLVDISAGRGRDSRGGASTADRPCDSGVRRRPRQGHPRGPGNVPATGRLRAFVPLFSSFCPYRGPEPAGRAMLSDWLCRARSQIAPIGPGAPKSVDRHGGGLGSALKSPPRAPGPDYCGCMDISHVAPDAASTLMMERPGPKSRGAEPTRRRCQGLEVAPQTKAMTAPVMAQACGIGPAETCSPKPAATMPPNQRTEGPHNPAAPNSCMVHSRSSVAEVKFQPDHPAARSSPRGSAEPRRSARSARSPSQRA